MNENEDKLDQKLTASKKTKENPHASDDDKVEILSMVSYRVHLPDGSSIETTIVPAPPPIEELKNQQPGTAWHPILQKWVKEEDVDKPMTVSEKDIFPLVVDDDDESENESDEEE